MYKERIPIQSVIFAYKLVWTEGSNFKSNFMNLYVRSHQKHVNFIESMTVETVALIYKNKNIFVDKGHLMPYVWLYSWMGCAILMHIKSLKWDECLLFKYLVHVFKVPVTTILQVFCLFVWYCYMEIINLANFFVTHLSFSDCK